MERLGERRPRILGRKHFPAPFEDFRRDPCRFDADGAAFAVQVLRRAAKTFRTNPGMILQLAERMDPVQELVGKPVASGFRVLEHAAEI